MSQVQASAGINAIVDALSVLGIKHVDTPCTPYRVRRRLRTPVPGARSLGNASVCSIWRATGDDLIAAKGGK